MPLSWRDEDASACAITSSADPEPLLLTLNRDVSAQASERTSSSDHDLRAPWSQLYRGRSNIVTGGSIGRIQAGSRSPMQGRSALGRDAIRGDISDED